MRSLPLPFVLLLLALWPGVLAARVQEEPDPFSAVLFTPEEIMEHGRAIGLNDEQRDAITRLIEELQGRAVALQWRLLDETASVKEALEGPRVDLDRVLDRFNQALDTEMDIKRAHLELLVRIKNVLTPAQQGRLRELRDGGPREGEGPPGATDRPGGTEGSSGGKAEGRS